MPTRSTNTPATTSPAGSDRRSFGFLRDSLDRLAARQDPAVFDAIATIPAWVLACGLVVFIVAVGAWIPPTAAFFQLPPLVSLAAFAPAAINGFGWALVRRSSRAFSPALATTIPLTSATLQFYCAVLTCVASPSSAPVFAALLVFTAAYHGHLSRGTIREPFIAVGTIVGAGAAAVLARTPANLSILAIAAPLGAVLSVVLGTVSRSRELAELEHVQMREAIRAQVLNEQMVEIRELADTLVEMSSRHHDLKNTISVAMFSAELLQEGLNARTDVPPTLRESSNRIVTALHKTRGLIATELAAVREAIERSGLPLESVPLSSAIQQVLAHVVPRRSTVVTAPSPRELEELHIRISGGASSLHRIIENLVLNAIEGDGHKRASRVEITARVDRTGEVVELGIFDDGPGFDTERLNAPIAPFQTSKIDGSGLGLYTVERLVRASGGAMEISNRNAGGAAVRVRLPLGGHT